MDFRHYRTSLLFMLVVVLAFGLLLIEGCKKDQDDHYTDGNDNNGSTAAVIDTSMVNGAMGDPGIITPADTLNTSFGVGETKPNIQVTTFPSAISISAPWHSGDLYTFDVDGDGSDDFRLDCSWNVSPGGIDVRSANIWVLDDNFEISVNNYLDSIFLCDTNFSGTYSASYYNTYTYTGCGGGPQNSFLETIVRFYPRIYEYGEILDSTESWQSDELHFCINNNSGFDYTYYNIVLPFWSELGQKYVVFRKAVNTGYLYGWLLLSVSDFVQLDFYEFALQTN